MVNILLTGGRSPAALELARAFHRAGHVVCMVESLRRHLSAEEKPKRPPEPGGRSVI